MAPDAMPLLVDAHKVDSRGRYKAPPRSRRGVGVKFFPLVWAGLWRRPVRSILTAICIAIAFVLLGLLQGVNAGFERAIANAHRRTLAHERPAFAGAPSMPISAMEEIRKVPGVRRWPPRGYFMGETGRQRAPAIATASDVFFRLLPALRATQKTLDAMRTTRTGVLVTQRMLDVFDWKVGQSITLRSRTPKTDGTPDWTFKIVGTFDQAHAKNPRTSWSSTTTTSTSIALKNRSTAETFYVRIDDPTKAVATSCGHRSDLRQLVARDAHPLAAGARGIQAKQMGDIKFFTNAIMGAVLFTLAFLTGNTLRQSLQDRSREFAVLKAMGYSGSPRA